MTVINIAKEREGVLLHRVQHSALEETGKESELWHAQNPLHSSSAQSPGGSPSLRRASRLPQQQLVRAPAASEHQGMASPLVVPTAGVLLLPDFLGGAGFANWINQGGGRRKMPGTGYKLREWNPQKLHVLQGWKA